MKQRTWIRILVVLSATLLVLVASTYFFAKDRYLRQGPLQRAKIVFIEKGVGLTKIAARLLDSGVIDNAFLFRTGVRYSGLSGKLRAGEYEFAAKTSMDSVASLIISGNTVKRRLTVPEGLLAIQIKQIVMSAPGLVGKLSDKSFQDGEFLPETYFYSYGDTRLSVVKRMQQKLIKKLKQVWKKRVEKSELKTPEDALILASIIEKETGKSSERAHVSGVFHNRLRRGMPLQSDPTVAYGVTLGKSLLKRPLSRTDLRTASPFNTYLNKGLPPRPISNPGLAAIRAAIMPMETADLYFVADGWGGHVFASTLKEHHRNVVRWRRSQRKASKKN